MDTNIPKEYEKQFYSRTELFIRSLVQMPKDNNIVSKLKKARVAITGDQKLLASQNGQHMILLSANLLARFCSNIDFLIPIDTQSILNIPLIKGNSLVNNLVDLSKCINPFGNFNSISKIKNKYHAILAIGKTSLKIKHLVSINSDGWLACVNTQRISYPLGNNNQNPLGAQMAACLGVAEIFKYILKTTLNVSSSHFASTKSLLFSTFDYSLNNPASPNHPLPESICADIIHLVGAGAIGSAVSYTLNSLQEVSGEIVVIDPEVIDISNLNRYILATMEDVNLKRPKVVVIKNFLSNKFVVKSFQGNYQDYSKNKFSSNPDFVIIGVDNDETRWKVQNDFPRIILNAGTGVSCIAISRHDDFLKKACLGCLFPHVNQGFNKAMPCPTISFVSGITGILLASEVIKEKVNEFHKNILDNELYFDCLNILATYRHRRVSKSNLCGCRCKNSQIIRTYKSKHLKKHLK